MWLRRHRFRHSSHALSITRMSKARRKADIKSDLSGTSIAGCLGSPSPIRERQTPRPVPFARQALESLPMPPSRTTYKNVATLYPPVVHRVRCKNDISVLRFTTGRVLLLCQSTFDWQRTYGKETFVNRIQLYGVLGCVGCIGLILLAIPIGDRLGLRELANLCLGGGFIGLLVSLLVFAVGRMTAK